MRMGNIERYLQNKPGPGVLVAYEKHGNRFFKAGNREELLASALKLLKERFESGKWYFVPESPEKPDLPMTEDEAKALKDGPVKDAILREYNTYKRDVREFQLFFQDYQLIQKAINENDGMKALESLFNHSSYEYERVELYVLE